MSLEPFTLIAWLMMGQRYEEVRMERLTREECYDRVIDILANHLRTRARCVGANGYVWPRRPSSL